VFCVTQLVDFCYFDVLSLVLSGENRIVEAFRATLEVLCPEDRGANLSKRPESQINAQWW